MKPCFSSFRQNHLTNLFFIRLLTIFKLFFFKKWANPGLFLFIFILFLLQFQYKMRKSVDGVLGIRTRGHRMVSVDKNMELWRPHWYSCLQAKNLVMFHTLLSTYAPFPTHTHILRTHFFTLSTQKLSFIVHLIIKMFVWKFYYSTAH